MSDNLPTLYLSNGSFLAFTEDEVDILRKRRLVGRHIGCPSKNPHQVLTSGIPYLYNHYAIKLILSRAWARFLTLKPLDETTLQKNKLKYEEKFKLIQDEAREEFIQQRHHELRKRNIEPSPTRVGEFDQTKMRLTVANKPEAGMSSLQEVVLTNDEVLAALKVDPQKWTLFNDLHLAGYHVTSGTKFGADFLAYGGDPTDYHAQYCVRLAPNSDGYVDLKKLDYNEVNAFHRLCHTANKQFILATVISDSDGDLVKYWTKKEREYLMFDSRPSDLDLMRLERIDSESSVINSEYEKRFRKTVVE